jgi:hypothetical protein
MEKTRLKRSNNTILYNYYSRALRLLDRGKRKQAEDLIYKEISQELYDLSLDILFNRNGEFPDSKLKRIIIKVDSIINEVKVDEDPLLSDNYLCF